MNILLTGAWQGAKAHIPALKAMGHSVCFLQYEKDALPCAFEWVEGVICNGLFLHHRIDAFSNLRYIQLTSAGFDRVDMEYCREKNIRVRNARGVYSGPMAEFALWGVLTLYKQGRFFLENQTRHRWEKHRGLLELRGKTVCIVGCGSVGNACAELFAAFGCRVLGVDLAESSRAPYEQITALSGLDTVLPKADVLVLTLPLTPQTRGLMNAERFAVMKPGAVLVNIARGAVVDTGALTSALKDHLGGAVLDVFDTEPLEESSPLWELENVILTPHNSFVGDHNADRLGNVILEGLQTV